MPSQTQMIDKCWSLCSAPASPLSTPWGSSIKTSEGLLFVSFLQIIYFESWESDRQANMTVFFPGRALQTGSWDNWIPAIRSQDCICNQPTADDQVEWKKPWPNKQKPPAAPHCLYCREWDSSAAANTLLVVLIQDRDGFRMCHKGLAEVPGVGASEARSQGLLDSRAGVLGSELYFTCFWPKAGTHSTKMCSQSDVWSKF